jgi:hypothetical protein
VTNNRRVSGRSAKGGTGAAFTKILRSPFPRMKGTERENRSVLKGIGGRHD